VDTQVDWVLGQPGFAGPKRALVLGASSGYGLSSAISLLFGAGADVIGVGLERGPAAGDPASTGTAGYWNAHRLERRAGEKGRLFAHCSGDVFADAMRSRVIDLVRAKMSGTLDAVVYSIASGRRTDPATGQTWYSTLKGTKRIEGLTINMETGQLESQALEAATADELQGTVKVMGGEDWLLWISALRDAGLLSDACKTVAYTYVGPPLMHDIYTYGALGHAKRHLEKTADELNGMLAPKGGEAVTASMKGIVSKASVFIPTFPVYGSVLFKIMKERGVFETTIQHTHRFLSRMLFGTNREMDDHRRLRPDSREIDPSIQEAVAQTIPLVTQGRLAELTDFEGVRREFLQVSGFGFPEVDYGQDVDIAKCAEL
jgi:enoyl-[acyl-carrier protein] reductase/trans-2-enoyl-CoA reductase (NAD+)